MPKKKRKEVERKTWTIECVYYDDDSYTMTRVNDGFNPIELIGLSQMTSVDVMEQIEGKVKPTRIKRKVITD